MVVATEDLVQQMVADRRDLHAHPELADRETRTAGIVADRLRQLGFDEVRTGVGTTGVKGVLRGGRPGRTVMLRADMDALPLQEEDRGQPYRSQVPGVHHACGHDGHVAILLATARLLAERRAEIPGTVVFVFQPAEERVGGAERMIADGVLEDPKPDACFALHLWNDLPVGTASLKPGPEFANADVVYLSLRGKGGHGASPHQAPDPIVAGAYLLLGLQTLVSRETPPLSPAALTFGYFHGGTAPNIIPASVEMQGTLRTFDDDLTRKLIQRIEEHTRGVAATFGLEATFEHPPGCPSCVNDAEMTRLAQQSAARVLGAENVRDDVQTGGADDMALFLRAVPGCYFVLGSANSEQGLDSPHHSPTFDFDERALDLGVEVLAGTAIAFLERR